MSTTEVHPATRRLIVLGLPAICAAFDVAMLIMQRMTAPTSDPTYELFHANISFSALIGTVLLSNLVLIYRYKQTLIVWTAQLAFTFIAGFIGVDSFFSLQLFIAFYTVAVTLTISVTIGAGLLSALVMLTPVVVTNPLHPLIESLPRTVPIILIGAIGISIRLTREAREERQRQKIEEQRSQIIRAQRDAAMRRSEIAGEIHDSVGHGLTAIISLSQGLAVRLEGENDDPIVAEALDALTTIAKTSLEDTRTALRSLATVEASPLVGTKGNSLHSWDDIRPVLDNARKLGIVTTLIETGRRAENPIQSDQCFRVTREAITNALRHGNDIHSISVKWNHDTDGSMDIEVTNDGKTAPNTAVPNVGTGLKRLNKTLQTVGGTLHYGASDEADIAWRVIATIPPTNPAGKPND